MTLWRLRRTSQECHWEASKIGLPAFRRPGILEEQGQRPALQLKQ